MRCAWCRRQQRAVFTYHGSLTCNRHASAGWRLAIDLRALADGRRPASPEDVDRLIALCRGAEARDARELRGEPPSLDGWVLW